MMASIAQLYLDIYRRGVRITVTSPQMEIHWPDDLCPAIRDEVLARQEELVRFLRRLKALAVEQSDGKIVRDTERRLSRVRFDRNCLVLIKPGDISQALFFPHSLSGLVAPSEGLSRFFPPDQAAFGFQAPGLNHGREPLGSIDEMAACYVTQMRSVNPQGPYFLCGWSLGGHIAFEMARQIHAGGGVVGLLVILDSRLPLRSVSMRERWLTFYRYVNYSEKVSRLEIFDRGHAFWQLSDEERLSFIFSTLKTGGGELTFPKNITFDGVKRHFAYLNAVCDAQGKYVPRRYPGPITFFRAEDCPASTADLWSELTSGSFRVVDIPGGHLSLMEYHNRGVVMEKLLDCLSEARRSSQRVPAAAL